MLDLLIRYAPLAPIPIMLWFACACLIAGARLPRELKKPRGELNASAIHALSPAVYELVFNGMLHSPFRGRYLNQLELISAGVVWLVCLYLLSPYLRGRKVIPGYPHAAEILLFLPPVAEPDPGPPRYRADRPPAALIGTIVLLTTATLSGLGMLAQPCGWLDLALQRSGCVQILVGQTRSTYNIDLAPGGALFAHDASDAVIVRTSAGAEVASLPHDGLGISVAFSPDGRLLATGGGWDETIYLWDTQTWQLREKLPTSSGIGPLAFVHDSDTLAFIDGTDLLLQHISDGAVELHVPDARQLALSEDHELILLSTRHQLEIWRAADLTRQAQIATSGQWFEAIALAPDGSLVAAAHSEASQITIWRADGSQIAQLDWPDDRNRQLLRIDALRFSPDGRRLIGGARDKTVRVWDVASGQLLHTLDQTSDVSALAFTPQGQLVIATTFDAIQLWEIGP